MKNTWIAYEFVAKFELADGTVKSRVGVYGGDTLEEAQETLKNHLKILFGQVEDIKVTQYKILGNYVNWFKEGVIK